MKPSGIHPAVFEHPAFPDHELLDSGDGEKLERFGQVTLVRPDPQVLWRRRSPELWERADHVFVRESDRGGRWEPLPPRKEEWEVAFGDGRFSIRPTPFKHVGLFPEQAVNWVWTRELAPLLGPEPRLLNLFGYTGAASVLAAQAGYAVTHVDASKTTLAWLRDNARLSGLADDALRLVLDDGPGFVRREARRGSRYAGILLDPPHYGRGPKGEKWQFESGIAPLLAACGELLAERSFLILSTYAIGNSPLAFANLLGELGAGGGEATVEAGELALPESSGRRRLPCGFCARWSRGLEGR